MYLSYTVSNLPGIVVVESVVDKLVVEELEVEVLVVVLAELEVEVLAVVVEAFEVESVFVVELVTGAVGAMLLLVSVTNSSL